ncbi:MAG: HEXXH motif-containing putative peptide modification protein [Minicystis sp.]
MTPPSLRGITMPEPGARALRAVMGRHAQHAVRDYLALPDLAPREETGARAVVRALLQCDPRAVVGALQRPTIAGLVTAAKQAVRERRPASTLRRAIDLLILTELAATSDLTTEIAVDPAPGGWPVLRSIASRRAGVPPAGARLVFGPEGIAIEDAAGRRPWVAEEAYHEITDGICFATSDDNPFLGVQVHPERAGNTIDLGGRPLDEWLSGLCAAFDVLRRHAPSEYEEMRLALDIIVPTGYDPERHFSVSYPGSVGAIYLSLHPNVMTLAEALIHEFQHNKLHAVFPWDRVLENAPGERHASPVRPDLRPLQGVLLAVHAFLPVARLYETMTHAGDPITRGRDWDKRFRQIIEVNREGTATLLAHARPTALGAELMEEIAFWDRHYAAYAKERWGA